MGKLLWVKQKNGPRRDRLCCQTALLIKRISSLFLSFSRSGFLFRCSFTFYIITTVVGIQQNLFQLGDQRVTRVSAGALVIECIFRQFIHIRREVRFLNASFTDRFRNTQFSFQRFQPCQQFLDLSSSTVARCAQTRWSAISA